MSTASALQPVDEAILERLRREPETPTMLLHTLTAPGMYKLYEVKEALSVLVWGCRVELSPDSFLRAL